ncbi:hypothetical protein C8R46DRAFT_1064556 [Mycena filopes]|nr:hypothetical protein C8R46DRAFT_1064556 [Mycena filopes]
MDTARAMSIQPLPMPLPGEDSSTCVICGLSLGRAADLPRHMLIHAKDKESLMFRCPMEGCGHSTLQKSNLATHIRTHTRAKPHKCPEFHPNGVKCDFSTADPSSLHRHRKRKHGYAPVRTAKVVPPRPYPQVAYVPRFAEDEEDVDELVSECESEESFGRGAPRRGGSSAFALRSADATAPAGAMEVDKDAAVEDDEIDGEGEPENETEPVLLPVPPPLLASNVSSVRMEPPEVDSPMPMPARELIVEPPPRPPAIAGIISATTRTSVDAQ